MKTTFEKSIFHEKIMFFHEKSTFEDVDLEHSGLKSELKRLKNIEIDLAPSSEGVVGPSGAWIRSALALRVARITFRRSP